jgi:hypothetical protein
LGTIFLQDSKNVVSEARKPRFQIGDPVRIVWPQEMQAAEHKSGEVTEILRTPADTVYRYRVTFPDGATKTFFGFELEPEPRAR